MLRKVWLLFLNIFTISLTANSGYAMLGVMKNRFVDKYGWLSGEEMADFIGLAQSAPGPIAVNASILIGFQTAGLPGALVCVLAVILPPFFTMILVSLFYSSIADNALVRVFINGMRAGVCAMLLDVTIGLFSVVSGKRQILYYALMLLSFLYVRLTDLSVSWLAFFCITAGAAKALMMKRKAADDA